MGKASKWIINFLIGKHERKKENVLNEKSESFTSITKPAGTPRVKRRWSFGKSAGKEASHKFSKSVDYIDTTKLPLKAQQINHAMPLSRDVENAAAKRIQASFRSHLARKALHALRGLVKLQALIRGHIVRKQTNDTVRRMHALMAIQVRARFQRIQMAEAAHVVTKKQSSIQRGFTHDNGVHRKTMDLNPNETQRVSKSPSGYFNHSQTGRIEHGCTKFYSERLSISKRHKYEESPFTTAENSPQIVLAASKPKPTEPSFPFQQHDCVDPLCYDYTFMPNYMANTQSSKAKVRSQSEPKQRPEGSMKHKIKHTELVDATHVSMEEDQVLKRSSSQFKPNGLNNHDPSWFVKLYRSRRLFEDSKRASVTPSTSHPNYTESLDAYEPHVILY